MNSSTLSSFHLFLYRYHSLPEPTATDWSRLDDILQSCTTSDTRSAVTLRLARVSKVIDDKSPIIWGDIYKDDWETVSDTGDMWRNELSGLLPSTYRTGSPHVTYLHVVDQDISWVHWRSLSIRSTVRCLSIAVIKGIQHNTRSCRNQSRVKPPQMAMATRTFSMVMKVHRVDTTVLP